MLRMKAQHSQRSFDGVGVALPGRVDSETQRLRFAPNHRILCPVKGKFLAEQFERSAARRVVED